MAYSNSAAMSELVAFVFLSSLVACSGTKILDHPLPLTIDQPTAYSVNDDMEVFLDWVIVRDGPGTWAKNADWDQYLLRFQNRSTKVISITNVAVFDSTDTRHETSGLRKELVHLSRATAKRYDSQGVEVKAGMGSGALLAAGTLGGVIAVEAGMAALYMSSAGAAVTLGALLAAPVLVTGGIVKGINSRKVGNEILRRQTALPLSLGPGNETVTNLFFPLTPSPSKVEVIYQVEAEPIPRVLALDTNAALDGLHIVPGK